MVKNLQSIEEIYKTDYDEKEVYEITAFITDIYRSPSGMNIFTVSDGEKSIKFVKFIAGAQAYPELAKGNVVRFQFHKSTHDGQLQGRLVNAQPLSDKEAFAFKDLVEKHMQQQFIPKKTQQLCPTESFTRLHDMLVASATQIRKAVFEKRPILLTHHADADGFAAALQLERAIMDLIKFRYQDLRYPQDLFQRVPSKTPYYDLVDATKDIALFMTRSEKNGLPAPLVLIVDNGSTQEDIDAITKVKLFGADVVVIDHHDPGMLDENGKSEICKLTLHHTNPYLVGLDKSVSASLLAYSISFFVNEHITPMPQLAAIGAVADKSQGDHVDWFIKESGSTKQKLEELALIVDYEIFHTKIHLPKSPLITLLTGSVEEQRKLVNFYRPRLQKKQAEVSAMVKEYHTQEKLGSFMLYRLDGEKTALWGDYFSIGKQAALLHKLYADDTKPHVILVESSQVMVFRVQQSETLQFDVNDLVKKLQQELPYARITGGGHNVAGSIKFAPIAKEEIMKKITSYIASL